MITFATAFDVYNAKSVENAHDPVERVRWAGYAIMHHDLIMHPLAPLQPDYLRRLWQAEGLIWTRR